MTQEEQARQSNDALLASMSVEERRVYLRGLRDQLLKQRETERVERIKKEGEHGINVGDQEGGTGLEGEDRERTDAALLEHRRQTARMLKEQVQRPGYK